VQQPYFVGFRKLQPNLRVILLNNTKGGMLWLRFLEVLLLMRALIRERLLALSDVKHLCTYTILESPLPLENYVATLRLVPVTDGNRTYAEWTAEFDCRLEKEDDLVKTIGHGVFQGGFDALKTAFA